jgi:pseudouridine kinase
MNMDLMAQPTAGLVPGDSNPGHIQSAPGGVARNVAENLARLGLAARLLSVVGDDVLGLSLLNRTHAVGVDVSAVQTVGGGTTSTYLSIHNAQGELEFAINDMALLEQLTPVVLQDREALLRAANAIIVDANLSKAALTHLMDSDFGGPIFADAVSVAKCGRLSPWLTALHLLKVNRLEAQTLSGAPVHTPADAMVACRSLQAQGPKQVVISLGPDGVCWIDTDGKAGHCPAARVEVVNVSGAGDALLAGLVFGHIQGWTLAVSVAFAMACAELTLGHPGANAPNLSAESVLKHLATRHTSPSN